MIRLRRLCWTLLLLSSPALGAQTLKVALIDHDLDAGEEASIKSLKLAASSLNIALQLLPLPEIRAEHLMEYDELDGEAFAYEIPGRQTRNMFKIDVPIESSALWIWVHQSQACIEDPVQLAHFKPVGITGIPYFEIFYQLSEVGYEKVSNPHKLVTMLRLGRADYFAATKRSINNLLDELEQQQIKTCFNQAYTTITSYFYLNNRHQEIAKALTQELSKAILIYPDDDANKDDVE
ncbi:hypothetical protein [Agarivorans sp.]|uniref:hypothetical protein n=1 Tax=Agarivorans sp. TaxID=1872412 RepID=UPI003D05B588